MPFDDPDPGVPENPVCALNPDSADDPNGNAAGDEGAAVPPNPSDDGIALPGDATGYAGEAVPPFIPLSNGVFE